MPQPHDELSDPELRCLARRAEWRDPEAVAELAEKGGRAAIPALQDLVRLGCKDVPGNFNTVRGAARTALAMLGDRSEFNVIVQQLKTWDYVDALLKLRYIGTREAVDAITMNIGETGFLNNKETLYQIQLQRQRNQFMACLGQMVKNFPLSSRDSYTDHDVEIWRSWWAKNGDHAELAVIRNVP